MTRFAFVTFLTFVRAPLALAGAAVLLANLRVRSAALLAAGLVLLAVSAVTDLFDGKLARKWGVTSRLGALADPLMDKVFYLATLPAATFLALACGDLSHAWSLLALDVVSLLRDQWASFLRSVGGEFGADVRASFAGKLRTFLAFPGIAFVHLQLGLAVLGSGTAARLRAPAVAVEVFLLLLTAWSGVVYTRRFAPYLRRAAAPSRR